MPWVCEGDGRPPATVRILSALWDRFGRSFPGEKLLGLGGVEALGRRWARRGVVDRVRTLPDDVTVLIGIRNRTDHRIVNALRSIREQVYPRGQVQALVVDYGSDPAEAARLATICRRFDARLVRVEGVTVWSRSRCLNVGLRETDTKFVMTSDSDLILSPGYLADAAATLESHPLSVVCAPMLDLPEESADALVRAAEEDGVLDAEGLKTECLARKEMKMHPSAGFTFTAYYHAIRGYDEFYEGWGREDDDLMSRLIALGIRMTAIREPSYYLHQWHPKYEGLGAAEQARMLERNTAYIQRNRSLIRNDESWGRPQGWGAGESVSGSNAPGGSGATL